MLSLALRRLILLLLLCLSFAPCAQADRAMQSMDANIRQSDLIVIADTTMDTKVSLRSLTPSVLLSIHSVFKGDQKWVGQTLNLPRTLSSADPLPRNAKNIAVLLKRYQSPAGEESWGVQETYAQPDQIAAIKALIPIYVLPTERAQLLALQELWKLDNAELRAQFIRDLAQMHEAKNFDLLLNFYPHADDISQKRMLEILGNIGDARALPLLISVLENAKADEKLRYSAAWQLNFYFPGAPGVTNAFRRVFPTATGNVQNMAARYLNEREPDAKYQRTLPAPTLWMRANALLEKGDNVGGRELWWQVLATPDMNPYSLRSTAQSLLTDLKPNEKARLRTAMLPIIRRDSEADNYLWRRDDANLLRAVGQVEDVDLLLTLADKSDSDDVARRAVVMTLLELGKVAQQKGAAHALQNLAKSSEGRAANIPHPDLLALAWLGSAADWQQAHTILGDKWQRNGAFLEALRTAAHATDEGAALSSLLNRLLDEPGDLQPETLGWIVFRLGDLADERAVPTLTKFLRQHPTGDDYVVTKALTRIGQKDAPSEASVVEAMTSVLAQPNEGRRRGEAVKIVANVQGARARPLLRRILIEDDFGSKVEALMALSTVGTADDLPLLLPLADFWTAPRGLQYWAHSAVTNLRGRFHLDFAETLSAAKV